jgi:hypothetical protein
MLGILFTLPRPSPSGSGVNWVIRVPRAVHDLVIFLAARVAVLRQCSGGIIGMFV